MALPQLYRFGREGKWFGTKLFSVFMFEGVVQVSRWSSRLLVKSITMCALQSAIIFFIILYGYFSPSARNDGFDVAQNEFSTTMAISAAIAANLFNGLNTKFWTAWVFFSVFIGIGLIWVYTVCSFIFLDRRLDQSDSLSTGHLFRHQWMVRHDSLRQRSLFVPLPHLLVRSSNNDSARSPSEVPLHGVDLRLQP